MRANSFRSCDWASLGFRVETQVIGWSAALYFDLPPQSRSRAFIFSSFNGFQTVGRWIFTRVQMKMVLKSAFFFFFFQLYSRSLTAFASVLKSFLCSIFYTSIGIIPFRATDIKIFKIVNLWSCHLKIVIFLLRKEYRSNYVNTS